MQIRSEKRQELNKKYSTNQQSSTTTSNSDSIQAGTDGVSSENSDTDETLNMRSNKYDDVHKLDASQDNPADKKYINFKQDYVVIIRKKPFYAATSQQRHKRKKVLDENGNQKTDENGNLMTEESNEPLTDKQGRVITPEDNYLRVYQVNNFMSARITSSVFGKSPGSCNVSIKGAERVVCAENSSQSGQGWLNWDELLNGWMSIDENGVNGDHQDTTLDDVNSGDKLIRNMTTVTKDKSYVSGLSEVQRKAQYSGLSMTEQKRYIEQTNGKSWKISDSTWASARDGSLAEGTKFRNLLKTREAKYGWRFAEKCDWEPMDELIIFGKSRSCRKNDPELDSSQRDDNGILLGYHHDKTSEFKFEPLFFGYIDSVVKTYTAAKGGCMITIAARDHLKLLELSRSTSTPTFMPGVNSGQGLEINWDKDRYGFYDLNLPLKDYHTANQAQSELHAKAERTAYTLENVLSGWFPDEIVQVLGVRAGIPDHYLTQRVEPIRAIPFLPKVKQSMGDLMTAEMKTRLSQCVDMANKLFLEFFADERGNLVLKFPNYVLGVNLLRANNMGIKYPEDIKPDTIPQFSTKVDSNGNEIITMQQSGKESTQGITGFINNMTKMNLGNQFQLTDVSKGFDMNKEVGVKPNAKSGGNKFKSSSSASKKNATSASEFKVTAKAMEDIFDTDNNNVKIIDNHRIEVTLGVWGTDDIATLYDIADKYLNNKYKWKEIAEANNISDPTSVLPGDKVIIYFDEDLSNYIVHTNEADPYAEALKSTTDSNGEYAPVLNSPSYMKMKEEQNQRYFALKSEMAANQSSTALQERQDTEDAANKIKANSGIQLDTSVLTFNKSNSTWNIRNNNVTKDQKTPTVHIPDASASEAEATKKQQLANEQKYSFNGAAAPIDPINELRAKQAGSIFSSPDASGIFAGAGINNNDSTRQVNNEYVDNMTARQNAQNTMKGTYRSGITDQDIPAIKPEYILSFTLMDTDKELYNMYEVGGDTLQGVQNGSNSAGAAAGAAIKRTIPDIDNILQFGMRPHPGMISTPLVQGPAEAEALGVMLLCQSYANRYTGTLNIIDDPSIKVGNPIRMYMYDEHPMKNVQWNYGDSQQAGAQSMFDPDIFKEQAVFYVTGIERSIDPSNLSTMTLQLKAGRMMGQVSIYDFFNYFFDQYYTKNQSRARYEGGNNTAIDDPHSETDTSDGTDTKADATSAS